MYKASQLYAYAKEEKPPGKALVGEYFRGLEDLCWHRANTDLFSHRKDRNLPRKALGGIEARQGPRKCSLTPLAHGFRGI